MKKLYVTALIAAASLCANSAMAFDMGRVSQPEQRIALDMGKVSAPVFSARLLTASYQPRS